MSRIALIAIFVVVGLGLALVAAFSAQAALDSPGKQSTQPSYSYGSP